MEAIKNVPNQTSRDKKYNIQGGKQEKDITIDPNVQTLIVSASRERWLSETFLGKLVKF